MRPALLALTAALVLGGTAACSGPPAGPAAPPPASSVPAPPAAPAGPPATVLTVGDRPVAVTVPPGYRPGTPAPLLVMLHGYGGTGDREEAYLRLAPEAAAAGMLYARPEGTADARGERFWNADPACCDTARTGVDDSAHLRRVIGALQDAYTVDPDRVYLVGVSNGGFMAHRLACDHAGLVAAIVSAAGAGPSTPCRPAAPVSVLQIHGDADSVVGYAGGTVFGPHPGAVGTVADWARRNGCAAATRPGPDLDLALSADVQAPGTRPLDGPETRVTSHPGCRPGGHAELWTVAGGDHAPALAPGHARRVVRFLLDHPKP
ncbi:alpha/beta hydrolase family esterase [Spirilliplanes yamanashiensis]|uniref:AB hydrolase-1 domain-containing protein n=1 Tax=Spirilliplanes yamanashiensis TaxID=42233 RepID=A0A8J4DKL3_9ACTN|nr:alpha/beta fold hydrolase [Spirilliplanes yamanashiensis]MDP9818972.1 polyhydroxybutyrate depolymerase [Spirilliplanes yamanashiensis]GIJ05427.1 hypothetical protein Sya03_47790 [Spirilliplanes yamanashiensis]